MELRNLGATGMKVSAMCLGAMMFGKSYNADEAECVRIIQRAIDAGINFIDTADGYSRGNSEEIVGKAIKGKRDSLFITTKVYALMHDTDPNKRGLSRRWIVREVEDSLKRLGVDYLDLYQVHRYDPDVDVEEVLFTLTELVRQGKIRQFGSSYFPPDRIVEAQLVAERAGLLRFRSEQPPYSIMNRDIERFVLPACKRYGMGVLSYSPMDGGFLSGKYRSPEDLKGNNRIAHFQRMMRGTFDPEAGWLKRKFEALEQLLKLADGAGIPLQQLSVAWVMQHPAITSAIIGPRTMEQLEGVLPAVEIKLTSDILDRIDEIVPPGTTFNPFTDQPSGLTKVALRRQ